MTFWYYYDNSGNRNGPINSQQLRYLASQGIINPETLLEKDTGKRGRGKQIRGLFPNPGTTNNPFANTNNFNQYQGGNQPHFPALNTNPGSVPFNGQFNTFRHKQSGKKTILKVGIGIGIGLIVLIGAMIAHDKYQRDLRRAKGQVEKQIMEERHRTEMLQYLRNL